MFRLVNQVLHGVYHNRRVRSLRVENSFDPKDALAVRMQKHR